MKKLYLLIIALAVFITVKAQWVNDPENNTFIANANADAGEVYLATNAEGDTYVQWMQFFSNGWSPTLQRLNVLGEPQWGADGIHIAAHEFSSMSEGVAMTATTDGGVVSCFSIYDGYTYAVKINADGTYAWGETGVQLFNGQGFSRAECIAGDDGGVWTLGYDYDNLYLQYVNADGSLNPCVTISDSSLDCAYGQLTLSNDNNVFVTYEKISGGFGFYKEKRIVVAGYATDGTQISPETLLMAGRTFQVTYCHTAIPDGQGGGYVYIWHAGIGESFNTYVFHFDQNGASTITDTDGIPVHTADPANYYLDAYATVDPTSHDILIAYRQTDASTESIYNILVNRITSDGERLWDEGKIIIGNSNKPCEGVHIDAFEDGTGFSVIYYLSGSPGSVETTVDAQGFDMDGNAIWFTHMCSNLYNKTSDKNSTGFHRGQNIVVWVNANNGGLYGQNISPNGEMGDLTTSVPEYEDEPIIEILEVYNVNGQIVNRRVFDESNQGIYIIKGVTTSGKTTYRKILR